MTHSLPSGRSFPDVLWLTEMNQGQRLEQTRVKIKKLQSTFSTARFPCPQVLTNGSENAAASLMSVHRLPSNTYVSCPYYCTREYTAV